MQSLWLKTAGPLFQVRMAAANPLLCNPFYSQLVFGQTRCFAARIKKVGINDHVMEEKRRLRKFGLKRHFYDSIPIITRDLPKEQ